MPIPVSRRAGKYSGHNVSMETPSPRESCAGFPGRFRPPNGVPPWCPDPPLRTRRLQQHKTRNYTVCAC